MRRSYTRARWVWYGVLGTLVAVGLVLTLRASADDRPAGAGHNLPEATLTVDATAGSIPVPPSFLGLSFETWGLRDLERHHALLVRTLGLLRAPGGPPLLVRLGGNSSDRSFWNPSHRALPRWAFAITPAYLRRTAALARAADLRLLVDLNLATAHPRSSVRLAVAAARFIGARRIAGFEVGNEPDLYAHAKWVARFAQAAGNAEAARLSAEGYARRFALTARLLARTAPAVGLVGPALGYPDRNLSWLTRLLSDRPRRLRLITAHLYPFTACARPRSPLYPTVSRLLSAKATAGLASSIGPAVALARRAGLTVRVGELNSVSCGGRAGVSDSFATALWAPNALFTLLRAGVAGVNIHVRARAVNGAFALTDRGLLARPLLYGMAVFAQTVRPGSRLIAALQTGLDSHQLAAWVVALPGGRLHVLAVNRGARSARLLLRLPAVGPATVRRLLAPGPAALGGVTFAGQRLDASGRWRGRAVVSRLEPSSRGYVLRIGPGSAALVSVAARPGTTAGRALR